MRLLISFLVIWSALVLAAPDKKEPAKPVEKSKSLKFTLEAEVADDCKITIELPASHAEPKIKTLTKEEFRKAAKEIMGRRYILKKYVAIDMKVTELHFTLPPIEKEEEEEDDFLKVIR